MKKRTVSLISAALLFLYSAFSVSAVSYSETAEKETAVARHLLNSPVPSVGSIGGEWMVIGLARSGKISKEFSDGYYSNAESYVKTVGSNKLHRSKSTENSRMIIALTAIGKDPRNRQGSARHRGLQSVNTARRFQLCEKAGNKRSCLGAHCA